MARYSPLAMIRQVASQAEPQLERRLGDFQAGEFIYDQPAPAGVEYTFKHALTQDVAYNSLLIERRKQLHDSAGRALESIFAEQLDDHVSELARHYTHSDNVSKAPEYLPRSRQHSTIRSHGPRG